MVDVLVEELPSAQSDELLRRVGRRLGGLVGGRATGDLAARVTAAAGVLTALGGDVQIDATADGHFIRGSGCPLSTVVSHRPEMCSAVEALVGEVVGLPVRSCCEHGAHPRCCFVVDGSDQHDRQG
jgi:predicted ArsR family transcriptional regulator